MAGGDKTEEQNFNEECLESKSAVHFVSGTDLQKFLLRLSAAARDTRITPNWLSLTAAPLTKFIHSFIHSTSFSFDCPFLLDSYTMHKREREREREREGERERKRERRTFRAKKQLTS